MLIVLITLAIVVRLEAAPTAGAAAIRGTILIVAIVTHGDGLVPSFVSVSESAGMSGVSVMAVV